jgi:hypothetical protein
MGAEEGMSPEEREKRNRLEDEAVDTGERARYNQQRARSEEGRSEVLDRKAHVPIVCIGELIHHILFALFCSSLWCKEKTGAWSLISSDMFGTRTHARNRNMVMFICACKCVCVCVCVYVYIYIYIYIYILYAYIYTTYIHSHISCVYTPIHIRTHAYAYTQ